MNIDERSRCRQSRPRQLLRQQLVARSFDMSKEIEHVIGAGFSLWELGKTFRMSKAPTAGPVCKRIFLAFCFRVASGAN